MGCGKSTAGRAFVALGFSHLDSDRIVGDLFATDVEVREALGERFGQEVLQEGGVNRPLIAKHVFGNVAELRWLEGLLHPRVGRVWQGALRERPDLDWVVEIPLLFENKLERHFRTTVCVEVSEVLQLQRLAHKGVSREQAIARQRRQLPLSEKVARADVVFSNHGHPDFLRQQVEWLVRSLRA